jgi:DNA-binding response OmpR family regulator
MNGAELGRQIQLQRPGLPILFVTGFSHQPTLSEVGEAFVVKKPFVDDELNMKIRSILSKPAANNVVRLKTA